MYDAANSLTGLSCFMTPELAQDLTNDILTLLSSSKPYIRKKAVLITYKVFLKVTNICILLKQILIYVEKLDFVVY